MISPIRLITCWGETAVFRLVVSGRITPLEILQVALHSSIVGRRSAGLSRLISSEITLQSPTMGTSATRFLEISAGSMSRGSPSPVGRRWRAAPLPGHRKVPSAISRSLRCKAPTAATVPCIPGMPMFVWLSGNTRAPSRW